MIQENMLHHPLSYHLPPAVTAMGIRWCRLTADRIGFGDDLRSFEYILVESINTLRKNQQQFLKRILFI